MQLIHTENFNVHRSHFIKKITPLHAAAESGNATVLQALLQVGANPSIKTEFHVGKQHTPLKLAHQNDHAKIVEILQEWMNPKPRARTHSKASSTVKENNSNNPSSERSPKKLRLKSTSKDKS